MGVGSLSITVIHKVLGWGCSAVSSPVSGWWRRDYASRIGNAAGLFVAREVPHVRAATTLGCTLGIRTGFLAVTIQ